MAANFLPGISEVTPTAPFRFWCQKVLPLVYDDSLSYYELLCKVVNYLNNAIGDINTLAGDVTAIAEAYTELENYVNTYFENLDVQQEINAKLDEMAENGTLGAIMGQWVQPSLDDFEEDINTTLSTFQTQVDGRLTNQETQISNLMALVGSPLKAATAAGMTDTDKIYVYTGNEVGYTAGNWYYWNGTAWTSGGTYNSAAVTTDATLTQSGVPADAAACGVVKNELLLTSDNYHITFESGARSITDPETVEVNANWKTALVACEPFQQFHVKGSGGVTSQLWQFHDSNYDFICAAGDSVREADYVTITAPPNAAYLVVNSRITEEPTYVGDCIVNAYLHDAVNDLKDRTLRLYTQEGRNVSAYTSSAGSTDWYWANNQKFPAGYVDHFVVYGTDNSIGQKASVAVYDSVTGKFIWKSEPVTAVAKKVTIPCKVLFDHDYYACISLPYLAHTSAGKTVKYAQMWEFALWEPGAVFAMDWKEADTQFKFAIECWYDEYYLDNELSYQKERLKMFVAGDSITAGYPYTYGISRPNYYDPDIRWGAQAGRILDMDVTFGAQTGSGWIYQNSPGADYAISIADNTDFSNYAVAVFAFGTNDYGNNIPLGNTTDLYPTNETVCGAMNYVINKVYTDNPKIVLIISTPINRADRGNMAGNFAYGNANSEGYTLLQLLNKMIDVCKVNGIPYIDNTVSAFNKHSLGGLLNDTLHPNAEGYKILGSYMAERIREFVGDYYKNVKTNTR